MTWQCDWCGVSFKLKRELAEHLRSEAAEAWTMVSTVDGQIEYLGIKP